MSGSSWSSIVNQVAHDYLDGKIDETELFVVLDPLLATIAKAVVRQDVESAMQEGRLAVWQLLADRKLDPSRSMYSIITRTANNAMRSLARTMYARHKLVFPADFEVLVGGISRNGEEARVMMEDECRESEDGVLMLYLEYVHQNGDFRGAHAAVAKELGIKTPRASTRFNKIARLYIERHGHVITKKLPDSTRDRTGDGGG